MSVCVLAGLTGKGMSLLVYIGQCDLYFNFSSMKLYIWTNVLLLSQSRLTAFFFFFFFYIDHHTNDWSCFRNEV